MKQELIEEIRNGLEAAEEKRIISETLKQLSNPRLKEEAKAIIPFSSRLNAWITSEFHRIFIEYQINFSCVDDFDNSDPEGSFNKQLRLFKEKKIINIWTGAGENTIFADKLINNYFRVWHDYTHLTMGLGYSCNEELIVGKIQASQLPQD